MDLGQDMVLCMVQDMALALIVDQVQSPQEVTTVQMAAMQQLSQVQQYPMAATPTEEQAEMVQAIAAEQLVPVATLSNQVDHGRARCRRIQAAGVAVSPQTVTGTRPPGGSARCRAGPPRSADYTGYWPA